MAICVAFIDFGRPALRPGLPEALPSPEELQREFAEAERGAAVEREAREATRTTWLDGAPDAG